jgi:hypothetical protein
LILRLHNGFKSFKNLIKIISILLPLAPKWIFDSDFHQQAQQAFFLLLQQPSIISGRHETSNLRCDIAALPFLPPPLKWYRFTVFVILCCFSILKRHSPAWAPQKLSSLFVDMLQAVAIWRCATLHN